MADPVEAALDTVCAAAADIRSSLEGRRAATAGVNPSGETQLAADVAADELLEERLGAIDGIATYASEEREAVVHTGGDPGADGHYSVAVDPLDGSSNLRSNNAMGTIVGVYESPLPAAGSALVAAGYVLYGPITTAVVARDGVVTEYEITEDGRVPVTEDVTLPSDPVVYGFGGRVPDWTASFRGYARTIEEELKLRYGGALVGDVNQVLTYGGVFAYPGLESRPEGKLRLQFEGHPIAAVIESAGGRSSDGSGSLLERTPQGLHERTPLCVGNEGLIERLESALD